MANLLSIEALEADKAFAQRQLEILPANPWGTARLMWEQRLAELTRQIETAQVSTATCASVALIFDGLPVVGQGDIRLDFSTDALATYQKIIAASLATLNDQQIATKGKIKGAERSKLYIRDIVRGSMGFILEELSLPQTDMFDTPLKKAVERATGFLASLNTATDEDFNVTIDAAAPRLISAVQKFTKVLKDAGATAKIVGAEQKIILGLDDINRLSNRLTDVEVQEESVTLDGVLLGVLPDAQTFELEVKDRDGVLKGSATDDLVDKYVADQAFKEKLLLKPVKAFLRYTRTFRSSKLLREQVTLENLEPRLEG
ncbi:hypothetical protein [Ciceribacter ferrooxidans]|uniref:Uncharacterized protein n=1 Tax=Ciceribacter ferrooxidans TaxID=2509717 RepID=A0A4Q2T4V1_9HYPH|nr:hypothetical protein [Ciceribacter ferrooxidans]RYC11779.1 hypothetical protein EUU22_11950 [Ciceribacter ferrooxidans]